MYDDFLLVELIGASHTRSLELHEVCGRQKKFLSRQITGNLRRCYYHLCRLPDDGWGLTAWVLGLGLSAAVACNLLTLAQWFTGLSMALSTAWMVTVGHLLVGKQSVLFDS